ncbi:hypothetical protein EGT74_08005 [Chitinophaga lutea]|uniref:Type I restriction modification DNA specificity domain-containing protein n=1 Tax=Chitinophaga lutea TaxID=2488634 RepID=A0A3N4PXK4_9BACT|nr:restriction endonuclease subunit S [Chitinophaga lutea]RPE13452.1 hypothetical protein EGT74_08005 [Chitinophaga lutea]
MKSKFPIHKLNEYINEVSIRNNKGLVSEVYSVTNSDGFIKSTDYFDKEVYSKNISNYKIVEKNQFAYNPSRINVGSIDYLRSETRVVISPLYNVFVCKSVLQPDYLLRFLKSRVGLTQVKNRTRGAVRHSLPLDQLGEISIPLPNVDQQLRISSLLSSIDLLLSKKHNCLQLLETFLKAQYYRLFGNPNSNSRQWPKKPFSEVSVNENSKRVPIKESERDKRPGKYPYYGATGVIDTIDDFIFNGEYLLVAEDGKNLLLKRKNNAFNVKGKFWVNNHAHVLSSNGEVNLRYLEFFINYIDLKPYLTGIDQVKLNRENLEKIMVPIPPTELQAEFYKTVVLAENLKGRIASSLSNLKTLYEIACTLSFSGSLNLEMVDISAVKPYTGPASAKGIGVKRKVDQPFKNQALSLKKIIQSNFKTRKFKYQELAELLQAASSDEHDYEKFKRVIFDCLKGVGEVSLKQVFDEKERSILLQVSK